MKSKQHIITILMIVALSAAGIASSASCQPRQYDQNDESLQICQRDSSACTGSEFIRSVDTIAILDRETMVIKEILSGNIPDFLRHFRTIEYQRNGHTISINVLPDYLAIGSNEDFVRMPMGPLAAQTIADSLKCSLPTALLVDIIAKHSDGAIEPFPFRPIGWRNTYPVTFEDSNNAINAQFKAKGYKAGDMISGLKKDVIITNKITADTTRRNHVTIYGWHYPEGTFIQRSNNIHVNWYIDYSHGIRLIDRKITIDGKKYDIQDVLSDPDMFSLLSDEESKMDRPTYAGDSVHITYLSLPQSSSKSRTYFPSL